MIRLLLLCTCCVLSRVNARALDDYVKKSDGAFGFEDFGADHVISGKNLLGTRTFTAYTLNLTSQYWLTDEDFAESSEAKSLWWHYLTVIIPDHVQWNSNGTLYVTGGSQGSGFPKADDEDIVCGASIAMMSEMIVGVLFQVPNEHVTFSSDPELKSRTEGEIDAFTWDRYLNNQSDPSWLYYFPMTKAAVKAMDAMTAFAMNWNAQLDYYTVMGASKRGWTTWLVGAVDSERVQALVPIVLDAINFHDFAHTMFKSYGGYSYALKDYDEFDILARVDTPEMQDWAAQDDPYTFASRLTMPKLIVNAGWDEFQMPIDSFNWWTAMPEPKHLLMTPNADHSEATGLLEILPAISAWLNTLLSEEPIPKISWHIDESSGNITVTLNQVGIVHEASMWYAYSCGTNPDGIKRRDWRLVSLDSPCDCGKIGYDGYCVNLQSAWTQVPLDAQMDLGQRTYTAHMDAPDDGRYVAYFIDVKYKKTVELMGHVAEEQQQQQQQQQRSYSKGQPSLMDISSFDRDHRYRLGGSGIPVDMPGRMEFTTQVSVWPNTFPYDDCTGEECRGSLL